MKALFFYLPLLFGTALMAQKPLQKLAVTCNEAYYTNQNGEAITKYYLAGSFEWTEPQIPVNVIFNVIQPSPNNPHEVIKTLQITNNPELFSPFNPNNSGFFMDKQTVIFSIGPFLNTNGLVLEHEVWGTGGGGNPPPLIQQACEPLIKNNVVVTPQNPN